MEQLVWAIIIIIFIIFTALKNRARNKPGTSTDRTADTEHKTEVRRDRLARYMEELLGIEIPGTEPQIRAEEEEPELLEKKVKPKPELKIEEIVGQLESPLVKKYEQKQKLPCAEETDIYHTRLPWGTLSGKDLKKAIIFAEILGPPISKRKSHRLF